MPQEFIINSPSVPQNANFPQTKVRRYRPKMENLEKMAPAEGDILYDLHEAVYELLPGSVQEQLKAKSAKEHLINFDYRRPDLARDFVLEFDELLPESEEMYFVASVDRHFRIDMISDHDNRDREEVLEGVTVRFTEGEYRTRNPFIAKWLCEQRDLYQGTLSQNGGYLDNLAAGRYVLVDTDAIAKERAQQQADAHYMASLREMHKDAVNEDGSLDFAKIAAATAPKAPKSKGDGKDDKKTPRPGK